MGVWSFGTSKRSDPYSNSNPGPGQYSKAGLKLDTKKPSWSFGTGNRSNSTKFQCSPGPAAYIEARLSWKAKLNSSSPCFTIGARPRTRAEHRQGMIKWKSKAKYWQEDVTPGPDYDITNNQMDRGCSIGKGNREVGFRLISPGPGEYSPGFKSTINISKKSKPTKSLKKELVGPGPGTYNVSVSLWEKGIKFTQ